MPRRIPALTSTATTSVGSGPSPANIAFDALLREEDILGIRTVTGADVADFRLMVACKPLACAQRTETGVAAYESLRWWRRASRRRRCRGTITSSPAPGSCWAARATSGREPDGIPAANVVQDCLDLLTGEDGFYTETARPMAVEADAVAHPYYVRTQGADPWLKSVTADRWAGGVITGAVPVGQMRWAAAQRQRTPTRGGHPVTGSAAGGCLRKNFTACSNKSERNVL